MQLLPHIRAFAETNNEVWSKEHPDDDVQDLEGDTCAAGEFAAAALIIPKEILGQVGKLHELGAAASGLQRAIFNIGAANEISFCPPGEDYLLITEKAKFYDLLWDALRGLTDTQNRIEAMFPHGLRPVRPREDL